MNFFGFLVYYLLPTNKVIDIQYKLHRSVSRK